MKLRLMDILACPGCGGPLGCKIIASITCDYPHGRGYPRCRHTCEFSGRPVDSVGEEDCAQCYRKEIAQGSLSCRACGAGYEIKNGVPRFLPRSMPELEKTKISFEEQYKRFPVLPEDEFASHFSSYLNKVPQNMIAGKGKIGLDAGCGSGRTVFSAAGYCAEMVGFDLTEGVDIAYRLNTNKPNVHFLQADIHNLPFKKEYFDFAYSFGVIHHLPDPIKGLVCLAGVLKPGGSVVIYTYRKYEDFFHASAIRLTNLLRKITVAMSPELLYYFCIFSSPLVYLSFVLPRKILCRLGAPEVLMRRLPFAQTNKISYIPAQLFDRFAPPVEYRYNVEELKGLFEAAGIIYAGSTVLFGHVAWGNKKDGKC